MCCKYEYQLHSVIQQRDKLDKENLSRWWGEDRENPRGEPLSLDLAKAQMGGSSRGFPYPHLINVINYLSCLFLAYTPL